MKKIGAMGFRSLFDDSKEPVMSLPSGPITPAPVPPTQSQSAIAQLIGGVAGIGVVMSLCLGCYFVYQRRMVESSKPVTHDPQAWERKTRADIAALGSEIQAAKDAYARQESFAKSRFISREDDRKEAARLNQVVLDLEKKRAELSAELQSRRKD